MANARDPNTDPGRPMACQIGIRGHLGRHWVDWLGAFTITLDDDGDTLLTGPVAD
jgi:hypothetical protein